MRMEFESSGYSQTMANQLLKSVFVFTLEFIHLPCPHIISLNDALPRVFFNSISSLNGGALSTPAAPGFMIKSLDLVCY